VAVLETNVNFRAKLKPPDTIRDERKLLAAGDGPIAFDAERSRARG
jgi:hypothetical protein